MSWFSTKKDGLVEFGENHQVGFLKMPKEIDALPMLSAITDFYAPISTDNRGKCTWTEDQGSTSQCAAYSTTSFAEAILWQIKHRPTQLDPAKVYARAKQLDGDPNAEGTSLDCAINALLQVYPDLFDKSCSCNLIRGFGVNIQDIKFAIHKYGFMIGGFNITTDWYAASGNPNNGWIPSKGGTSIGGHAVLCCGYNENGLIIQNSWGTNWCEKGFGVLRWSDVRKQFMYGAVIKGCLKHLDD